MAMGEESSVRKVSSKIMPSTSWQIKNFHPSPLFFLPFFLLTFQLDWLKIVENRSAAVCQLTLFALAANLQERSS